MKKVELERDKDNLDTENQKLQCFGLMMMLSGISNSPAGQVSSAISLQSDGRLADLSVSNSLQPTSHRLLDLDTGRAELIRPELLQVRYLTRPEENLGLTKLEHVRLLRHKRTYYYDSCGPGSDLRDLREAVRLALS